MTTQTTKITWKPLFQRTLDRGEGVKVDMYIVRDCLSGESMITLGVPHGDKDTPQKVCQAMNLYGPLKEKYLELLRFAGRDANDA